MVLVTLPALFADRLVVVVPLGIVGGSDLAEPGIFPFAVPVGIGKTCRNYSGDQQAGDAANCQDFL
jgi:hypothetical protein